MLFPTPRWAIAAALLTILPIAARAQYTVKEADTPPPAELNKAIGDLLERKSLQFLNPKGELVAELWFRKEVPSNATAAQLKNGLTYREVPETTLLGAIKFDKLVTDYRKQKIKAGVYTLRLAYQPQDGDHMGTAPYAEFCLLVPAAEDKSPEPLKEAKELHELSTKATGSSHPGVLLLFPVKDPGPTPKVVSMAGGHWLLTRRLDAVAKGQKGVLFIGLTLVGTSTAA